MKAIIIGLSLSLSAATHAQSATYPSKPLPVGSEDLSIYRDFLRTFLGDNKGKPINISRDTIGFFSMEIEQSSCLKEFISPLPAEKHRFTPDAFSGTNSIIIDPKHHKIHDPSDARKDKTVEAAVKDAFDHGLFSFSEVLFDSTHTHAAFSYSFHCGKLCGKGGVLVYERQGTEWHVDTKSKCGEAWIN